MKAKLLFAGIFMMLCGLCFPAPSVSAQELEEKTEYLSEEEFQEILDQMVSDTFQTMSSRYDISWSIDAGIRYTTEFFSKSAGSSVTISFELSKTSWAGILNVNRYATYVEGKSILHTFKITENGGYCVFVKNITTGKITAKGYYIR